MYSIYVLILVSTFGSPIYCQFCLITPLVCDLSPICCFTLDIPKSIPRTGGLIRIFTNFTVDNVTKNRPDDFILRFRYNIYKSNILQDNRLKLFYCQIASLDKSSWTCFITDKSADSTLDTKELIKDLYLFNIGDCCYSRLIMSNYSSRVIYTRDPGILYAPDYVFPGLHKGLFKVQFTYCPNEYYTDYTEFTLNNSILQKKLVEEHASGLMCTFTVKVTGNYDGKSSITVIIKINNLPLATNMTFRVRKNPSFEDFEWVTFHQASLHLTIRGKNFDSLYQPHYDLSPTVGYKDYREVYRSFLTPCQVANSTLMQCYKPIITGKMLYEIYRLRVYSHGQRISVAYNLKIEFRPTPVILYARLSMDTDKILELYYDHIDSSYSPPVVQIVQVKRNVYVHKIECTDVYLDYPIKMMNCLINEDIDKKFRWWVEMTIENYTLNPYCIIACDTNLGDLSQSDSLTYILVVILIVLIILPCLYIYLNLKSKRQAANRYKRKLFVNTPAHPKSFLASFYNNKSYDNIAKSSRTTRSKASLITQKRLMERTMTKNVIPTGINANSRKET